VDTALSSRDGEHRPDPPAGLLIGDRFRIERRIGGGGMGRIFRARDLHTDRAVAVKLLAAASERDLLRFEREALLLLRLTQTVAHPRIVGYVAHGVLADQPYLVMEWLEGEDLASRLRRGPLAVAETVTLLRGVAEGLSVLHRSDVVHRDIKPSNLFLRNGEIERVTLLDLGLAHWLRDAARLTKAGALLGTPDYMSPEQARSDRPVTPASDLFSLGCVLYECLSGRPPFHAEHMATALVRTLLEEPVSVRLRRPEIPGQLEALVHRMLQKEPLLRPATATELLPLLAELPLGSSARAPAPAELDLPPLSTEELRLFSVILAVPAAEKLRRWPQGSTLAEEDRDDTLPEHQEIQRALQRLNARCEQLADGTLLVALAWTGGAAEHAVTAARCALLVKEHWAGARVALATGRGVLTDGPLVGEGVDRALALLKNPGAPLPPGRPEPTDSGVLLDALSMQLLEGQAVLARRFDGQPVLQALQEPVIAQALPAAVADRQIPFIGRELELQQLLFELRHAAEESVAAAALVFGAPGIGKSRLLRELVLLGQAQLSSLQTLIGRGDPMRAGSPYATWIGALLGLCCLHGSEPVAFQRQRVFAVVAQHLPESEAGRVAEFLCELASLREAAGSSPEPSPLLSAARIDPRLMAQQVRRASLDLLAALCARGPVLLVLEDLHWCDTLSIRLVGEALEELAGAPLLVLGLGRPEMRQRLPEVWQRRVCVELQLPALGRRACERLARLVLGPAAAESQIVRIASQAGGNPLYLEQLLRAAAEGRGDELPATVLALLQSRVSLLSPEARRVAQAASIFGTSFWVGGVRALLGGSLSSAALEEAIEQLWRREVIERSSESRISGEREYRFLHALWRDAAYSLLTEENRQLGHRIAGEFLARAGEPDPLVIAEHLFTGGALEQALGHYLRAADHALHAGAPKLALQHAKQARLCRPDEAALGELLSVEARALSHRGRWQESLAHGSEGLSLIPAGRRAWYQIVQNQVSLGLMLGRGEVVTALTQQLLGALPEEDAHLEYAQSMSSLSVTYAMLGQRALALRLLERLREACALRLAQDLRLRGYLARARSSFLHLLGADPWQALFLSRQAWRAYVEAGDVIAATVSRASVVPFLVDLGAFDEAEAEADAVLCEAELPLLTTFLVVARVRLVRPTPERLTQIEQLCARAAPIIERQNNRIFQGLFGIAAAELASARGRTAEAEQGLRTALIQLAPVAALRPYAMRLLLRILLNQGRLDEAALLAAEAEHTVNELGPLGEFDIHLRQLSAEVSLAAGQHRSGCAALSRARDALLLRAGRILDRAARRRYLTAVPLNARVLVLSRRWLTDRSGSEDEGLDGG
jgi:serine/threonine protein kinase/tetratricopeptide (TPR) repeat protein